MFISIASSFPFIWLFYLNIYKIFGVKTISTVLKWIFSFSESFCFSRRICFGIFETIFFAPKKCAHVCARVCVCVICLSNKREHPHLMLNLRLISIRLELSKFSLNFDLLRDSAHIWCALENEWKPRYTHIFEPISHPAI